MEVDWIEDGHKVIFQWNVDSLEVASVVCPFESGGAICRKQRDGCVVSRFIGVYGAEVNIGKVVIDGPVEIAWVGVLGESDLDGEFSGIWVIPINDSGFIEAKESAKDQ